MKLIGRTAIVTGAGTGIGKAIARRFAEDGARVVIADIQDYETSAREIELATGGQVLGLKVDVSNETDTVSMVQETAGRFGSIDILVNNAGLFSTLQRRPFEQIRSEEWRRVFDVNVLGAAACCKAVVDRMRAQKWGRIINMASAAPLKGVPWLLHYISSKGALIAMTRGLARELGDFGITVNAIAPGFTVSDAVSQNPHHMEKSAEIAISSRILRRQQTPDDIVGTASFLASDDASFITGQTIAVDGGAVML